MPRPASVTVVIEKDTGKKVVRLLSDPRSGGVPVLQDHVLQFNNNQNGKYSDGFEVSFHLPANLGKNGDWLFDDPPIWVKLMDKEGACPLTVADHDPAILTNPRLTNGGRTLTLTNRNAVRQFFGFALRFQPVGNGRAFVFDPVGDNQNGNKQVTSASWFTYSAIAVGAGIVSAVVTVAALTGLRQL